MAGEQTKGHVEIGHVLFIDIVGYSKLLLNQQAKLLRELNQTVSATSQFQAASAEDKLIRLPTGDGMALVFRTNVEAPAQCALEIAQALNGNSAIQLRMGIHSGPVHEVADVNERANIAGAGINVAQRVMDCGDAGHILVSKHVAEDLEQDEYWQPLLHDLGECEVKHGLRLHLFNLYSGELGNAEVPQKLKASSLSAATQEHRQPLRKWMLLTLPIIIVLSLALVLLRQSRTSPSPARATVADKSIAVLPFENLSEDKANAYFADGVQDEILTNLAKVADLKVISRTSVMQYRNPAARNLREIGQVLGVAHVLEGSVQKITNKVRVNAQLIDARNDAHLWAQTYDRDLADVFGIQTEIAEAIAQQLAVHLSSNEKTQIAKPPTKDLVAYDLYLRARELDDLFNDPDAKGSLLQGITLLEEAVRRDPKFLRAYCLMCETHLDLYWEGFDHTDQRRELARVALQHAEEIQPDAGEVHWQKGVYAYHGFRDYDRALAELELARRLLPNEARIYVNTGAVARRTGRWEQALTNFNRAVELDPRNFVVLQEAGSTFAGMRRMSEARRFYERALTILPNDPFTRTLLGFTLFAETGDITAWRNQLDLVVRQGPDAARGIAFPLLLCSWMQRDRAASEKAVGLIPAEGIANSFDEAAVPKEYCVGRTAWLFGDKNRAQTALFAARAIFERVTHEQPDYAQAWSYLGLTDAMLGRPNQAIEEGKRACELLPLSRDAWAGPAFANYLATIYACTAEKDLALKQLELSAANPVGITYGELKCNPDWDSLRGDPRFEKIVASLAPKK